MTICINRRFIERDYMFQKIFNSSPNLTFQQINDILNGVQSWSDLTFRFYLDGSVTIINNVNDREIKPNELTGNCLDYYVRQRIEQIKNKLTKTA